MAETVTRSRAGKTVYQIAYSDEYLKNNGMEIYGYSPDFADGKNPTSLEEALSMYPTNRLRVKGPLIDQIPTELGVSWGMNVSGSNDIMEKIPGLRTLVQTGKNASESLGINTMAGRTAINFASTIQIVEAYSFPEFTISTVLSYHHQQDYTKYINALVSLASPSLENSWIGNLGFPEGYKPPVSFSNYYNNNKNFYQSLPLDKACAVKIGSSRFFRGMVVTGVSIVPSSTYVFKGSVSIPTFCKVTVRFMGARVFFDTEYGMQWSFNKKLDPMKPILKQ